MYERKDREEREAREALANIKTILAERDTLIRQRAADLEALNAVQALHAQAVAERDEARAEMEAMRELLADSWPCRCGHPLCKRCKHDDEVRDALRARKVGG